MIKDTIVNGAHNAPHRSLYNALGLTKEELSRPLIGIVSSYNEIVPGHMNLDKITEAVRLGVAMGGKLESFYKIIQESTFKTLRQGSISYTKHEKHYHYRKDS